jgi:hypothetical protein
MRAGTLQRHRDFASEASDAETPHTRTLPCDRPAIMAVVNRMPDSFYDRGATYAFDTALRRVGDVVSAGAEIVDVGGVKAAPGTEVTPAEEIVRTEDFVAAVRERFPAVVISIDTWRHEVGATACEAGADLLNDAWGGWEPRNSRRWRRSTAPAWYALTPARRSPAPAPTGWPIRM